MCICHLEPALLKKNKRYFAFRFPTAISLFQRETSTAFCRRHFNGTNDMLSNEQWLWLLPNLLPFHHLLNWVFFLNKVPIPAAKPQSSCEWILNEHIRWKISISSQFLEGKKPNQTNKTNNTAHISQRKSSQRTQETGKNVSFPVQCRSYTECSNSEDMQTMSTARTRSAKQMCLQVSRLYSVRTAPR